VREATAGTTPVLKNTRTRLAVEISSSAALAAFVSPGQRGQNTANTYGFASVPPVAGDDPVNESDPTGLYNQLRVLASASAFGYDIALNQVTTGRSRAVKPGMVRIQFEFTAVAARPVTQSIVAAICQPPRAWDHLTVVPPPSWDQATGSSATVMGPPFRQSWDHP